MACAHFSAGVALKVFVEQDQVAPVRVFLKLCGSSKNRPVTIAATKEGPGKAPGKLGGYFPQRHHISGAGRALDFEIVAQVMVKLLKRFDDQVVDREPDGASPVGIAAEQASARFGWLVPDAVVCAVQAQNIGTVAVGLGHRSDSIWR